MEHNVYIYILVMGAATYLVRAVPLIFIRHEIKNTLIRSFLYYVPYVTLAVMTFPSILGATRSPVAALAALVTGILAALGGGGLLKVSAACCIVVYISERILPVL